MSNPTQVKNELFLRIEELGQKLFFDSIKTGPVNKLPIKDKDWPEYLDCCKKLNEFLPVGSKRLAIVVTSSSTFVKNEGFRNFFYHHTIMDSDDYGKGLAEAMKDDRVLVDITKLNE